MADDFQVGDVVRLKSGGPAMTVTQIGERAGTEVMSAWCVWFDVKGNEQTGCYPLGAVAKEDWGE